MKRIFIIFIACILVFVMSIAVFAAEERKSVCELSDQYFFDGSVYDKMNKLYANIDDDDIEIATETWDTTSDYYDNGVLCTQTIEHRLKTAFIRKYNTSISCYTKDGYNIELKVSIGKEGIEFLHDDLKSYFTSVDTMAKAMVKYRGETDYDVETYMLDMDGYFYENKYILIDGFDLEDFDSEYGNRVWFQNGKAFGIPTPDVAFSGANFMVRPDQIRLYREYIEMFAMNHPEMMDGFSYYDVSLNYAPVDGVAEGDYLNYTLDSVEFILQYYYEQAPQTGFATYAYAAVAIVAAAVAVAVVKRRRKAI